jgi:hypothetical protein
MPRGSCPSISNILKPVFRKFDWFVVLTSHFTLVHAHGVKTMDASVRGVEH